MARREIVFAAPGAGVYVVDERRLRSLRLGGPDAPEQALTHRDDPADVRMAYVHLALLGLAYADRRRRALMVGLGSGAFAQLALLAEPALRLTAVEVEPAVVEAARRCFGLAPLEEGGLEVVVEDAARFMARGRARYDLLFVDAFSAEGLVPELAGPSFYRAARRRLSPGGVCVLNVVERSRGRLDPHQAFLDEMPVVEAVRSPDEGNLVLFGRDRALSQRALRKRARALSERPALSHLPSLVEERARLVG